MNATLRTVLVVTLVVVAVPLLWGVLMMSGSMMGGWGPGMMWGTHGVEGSWRWGGLIMMLPGLLIIGAIVVALVWGLGASGGPAQPGQPSARDILDTRYARGEVSREEYQRMKADLTDRG